SGGWLFGCPKNCGILSLGLALRTCEAPGVLAGRHTAAPTNHCRGSPHIRTKLAISNGQDLDRNIASDGLGIWAQLVGAVDDLLRSLLLDVRYAHHEFYGQAETFTFFANPYLGVDDRTRRIDIQFFTG